MIKVAGLKRNLSLIVKIQIKGHLCNYISLKTYLGILRFLMKMLVKKILFDVFIVLCNQYLMKFVVNCMDKKGVGKCLLLNF